VLKKGCLPRYGSERIDLWAPPSNKTRRDFRYQTMIAVPDAGFSTIHLRRVESESLTWSRLDTRTVANADDTRQTPISAM
jgi:hypothetical protein